MGDQMVFILVGIGMIAVGLYLIFGKIGGQKPGQILVEATIVSKVSRTDSSSGDHPNSRPTTSTFPVYEYTVDGTKYRTEGNVGITVFSQKKYQPGNTEMIRLDPHRPRKIHTDAERNSLRVFGVAFLFFGLIALYMVLSDSVMYY